MDLLRYGILFTYILIGLAFIWALIETDETKDQDNANYHLQRQAIQRP